ncbi:MAG: M20/M25/M40 family metallo-hydrolase [Betaproteobacteria bacterium]|nr:M20/M25/M40 family metallo-hydrolase [Betaproteobacteria bacterium]
MFDGLLASREVQQGLAFLKADDANTLAEQKAITMIPAPPFKEQARAGYCLSRFAALGLEEVRADDEGNVIGVRPGNGGGPKLVVSAHLDTVFPEGTELKIVEEDGRLFAPGIGDDARGLAEVLSLIRAFNATGVKTAGDLHFVCTVGEEGLGDLRGVKALFRDHQDIDGFISIDGPNVARVTYLAAGSHRYRVTFKGPGGHSFNEFGRPSAIHAMGRAIAGISELRTPAQPKTTFTVGTVRGGTSVNAIAGEAVMEVDMRSVENPPLLAIEAEILKAIRDAVAGENARWGSDQLSVEIELVGDRPAGAQPLDSPIMQAALAATRAVGVEPAPEEPGSTDSNLPISLGVPAVTLGRGGKGGNQHSRGEWFDPTDAYLGPQRDFLVILALAGVEGVSAPVLPKRPPRS